MQKFITFLATLFLSLFNASAQALDTNELSAAEVEYKQFYDSAESKGINERCNNYINADGGKKLYTTSAESIAGVKCYLYKIVKKIPDKQYDFFVQLGENNAALSDDMYNGFFVKGSPEYRLAEDDKFMGKLQLLAHIYNLLYNANNAETFPDANAFPYPDQTLINHCNNELPCIRKIVNDVIITHVHPRARNKTKDDLAQFDKLIEQFVLGLEKDPARQDAEIKGFYLLYLNIAQRAIGYISDHSANDGASDPKAYDAKWPLDKDTIKYLNRHPAK